MHAGERSAYQELKQVLNDSNEYIEKLQEENFLLFEEKTILIKTISKFMETVQQLTSEKNNRKETLKKVKH